MLGRFFGRLRFNHPLPANLLDTRIRGPRWSRLIMLGMIGAIGGALLGVECATLVTPTYRAAATRSPSTCASSPRPCPPSCSPAAPARAWSSELEALRVFTKGVNQALIRCLACWTGGRVTL